MEGGLPCCAFLFALCGVELRGRGTWVTVCDRRVRVNASSLASIGDHSDSGHITDPLPSVSYKNWTRVHHPSVPN
ncbi:hypothetical protein EDB89DRAFT_1968100 [Lactarius sanguifluus]|nr:hypothetical protein EDB89DRAFT_1968100 [Lactarius sanguifluus]